MTTQTTVSPQFDYPNRLVTTNENNTTIYEFLNSTFLKHTFFLYFVGANQKIQHIMKYFALTILILFTSIQCIQAQRSTANTTATDTLLLISKCHIDDWAALKELYNSTDGDNWRIRSGWDVIANNINYPEDCDLSELYGVELNIIGRVEKVQLTFEKTVVGGAIPLNGVINSDGEFVPDADGEPAPVESDCIYQKKTGNNLRGNLPNELGLLANLKVLDLGNNFISGNIPSSLSNLNQLETIYLNNNDLSGTIPTFPAINCLKIEGNLFNCSEIDQFLSANNNPEATIKYSPQYFEHNYEPFIASPSDYDFVINFQYLADDPNFGIDLQSMFYIKRNGTVRLSMWPFIPSLSLNDYNPYSAGKYTFHMLNICVPDLEIISKPIYVIYPGYDLTGNPVETNQITVEFDNNDDTEFYEDEILYANAGFVIDSCNCNRELYLWQFPSDSLATLALLSINQKQGNIKEKDNDIDGGFNNLIEIGNNVAIGIAYDVLCNMTGNYSGEVSVYLLDTGLDNFEIDSNTFLINNAPVDDCYGLSQAAGYNYTDTIIDTDFVDLHGHGTYGFRAITDQLTQSNNINVIPLKVFDDNGYGNLFDLTCAIYHAIDHQADIINISAGYKGQHSNILENAINAAKEEGIFIITAAGNDSTDIDSTPQYPAYFASQYYYFLNEFKQLDSIRYDNVISIASLDTLGNLSNFSNYGEQSVTISAYGEDLRSFGLGGSIMVASGTSMATYFVTRQLALEIASNKNRTYKEIWAAFENNSLIHNPSTVGKTRTAKQLEVTLQKLNCFLFNATFEPDSDDFETNWGIWNDGGSDCYISGNSDYATTGNYSLALRDNGISSVTTTNNLNLSDFDEISIKFSYIARSMDSPNEDFWFQISYDGGATFTTIEEWNLGDEFENDQQKNDMVVINGPFSATTELRFRCHASTNSDWVYLDDIEISGCKIDGGAFKVSNEDGSFNPIENEDNVTKGDQPYLDDLKLLLPSNAAIEVRNYPNPFNNHTNIEFKLNESMPVSIIISDMLGQQIVKLLDGEQLTKGIHLIQFDSSNYSTGVYYYTLQAGENAITQKMSIIK